MALSEKSRSELYQALEGLAGPEATQEMLSQFPSRDVEASVTASKDGAEPGHIYLVVDGVALDSPVVSLAV